MEKSELSSMFGGDMVIRFHSTLIWRSGSSRTQRICAKSIGRRNVFDRQKWVQARQVL